MREIPAGRQVRHELVVTPEMTVDFEQDDPKLGALHPVYATYWMAKHMELASRKIILPYLEDDEEGIGFRVEVSHLASALPGMRVRVEAVHRETAKNRVHVDCRVYSELGDLIGEGSTVQVILKKDRLESNFAALRERAAAAKEPVTDVAKDPVTDSAMEGDSR